MLLGKAVNKNPSFFKYVQWTIGLTLSLVIVSFVFLFLIFESRRAIDIQKEMVKEQVFLITNVLDKYSIVDQIDYLTKTVDTLKMVSGVAVLDRDCKILRSQPMNLSYPNPCTTDLGDQFVAFKIDNALADSINAPSRVVMRLERLPTQFTTLHIAGLVLLALFFLTAGYLVSRYIFKKTFIGPISKIIKNLKGGESFSSEIPDDLPLELIPAHEAICERDRELKILSQKLVERKELEVLQKISRQVLHDVKSPLVLLKKLVDDEKQNDSKPFVQTALNDLESIIGRLMKDSEDSLEKVNLSQLLRDVIENKKIEYSGKKIQFLSENIAEDFFVLGNANRLKTTISNIVNNSVQAISKKGKVNLYLEMSDSGAELVVKDNGKGISAKNIKRVTERGISFDKPYGQGLGLSDAKECAEQIGGSLAIKSTEGVGTSVVLTFPLYRDKQKIVGAAPFDNVLIDDYELIQNVCMRRAKELNVNFAGLSSPLDFDSFEKNISPDANIYVDSIFDGLSLRGENWAKTLFDRGYKNLYLCSTNEMNLAQYPWFKGFVKKQDLLEKI